MSQLAWTSAHAPAQASASRFDTCEGKDASSTMFGNRSCGKVEASPAKCSAAFSANRKRHDSPKAASKIGVTATSAAAAGAAAHDDQQQPQQQQSPWRPPALVTPPSPEPMADADAHQHDQKKPLTPLDCQAAEQQGPGVASSPTPKYCQLMAAATAPQLGGPQWQQLGTASQQQQMLPTPQIIIARLDLQTVAGQQQQQQWQQRNLPAPAPVVGPITQQLNQQHPHFAAIPAAMPSTVPSLVAYKPQQHSASLQLEAACTSEKKHRGVRAAATLLGSGDSTPECLSPALRYSGGAIAQHAAALEAALWSSRLQ